MTPQSYLIAPKPHRGTPTTVRATSARLGPLTASDLARVQAEVAKAAKGGPNAVWQSWCRVLFELQDLHRDRKGGAE